MRLTKSEYDELIRRKPSLAPFLGGLQTHQPKPTAPQTLDSRQPERKEGSQGVGCRVLFTACRRKALDDDNNVGSLKNLRDAVAKTLGIDDGDKRIQWEYSQVITKGKEGVMVKVEFCDIVKG